MNEIDDERCALDAETIAEEQWIEQKVRLKEAVRVFIENEQKLRVGPRAIWISCFEHSQNILRMHLLEFAKSAPKYTKEPEIFAFVLRKALLEFPNNADKNILNLLDLCNPDLKVNMNKTLLATQVQFKGQLKRYLDILDTQAALISNKQVQFLQWSNAVKESALPYALEPDC